MSEHRDYIKDIFDRLFKAETPPGGERAFTAQIQFRSGYAIQGVVTTEPTADEFRAPRETLRMACPSLVPDPKFPNNRQMAKKIIAEHYFDYEDVESVIVVRDVDASKIAGDNVSGPKIILGG